MSKIISAPQSLFETTFYPGYIVTAIVNAPRKGLLIRLKPLGHAVCPRCGSTCSSVHQSRERRLREAPFPGSIRVWLEMPVRRVRCRCGCRANERIPWVVPHQRMTARFIAEVQRRLRSDVSVNQICHELDLSWKTVRRFDKEQLEPLFSTVVPSSSISRIMIDELSILKGQRYLTVFMDCDTKQIFDVVVGKTIKAMRPAFERLAKLGLASQIRAVACDMNSAYSPLVAEYLPNAQIVYDQFHVMKLTSDGLCKEARQAQAAAIEAKYGRTSPEAIAMRRRLRRSEYVLIANPKGLKPDKRERLEQLLKENQILAKLYPLMDLLRSIWTAWSPDEARETLSECIELLDALHLRHGLKKAAVLARTLEKRCDGLVYACMHRISTSPLEGANCRAKLLKRIAYGYRDIRFFMLKLKAAFPGRGINPWHMLSEWSCCFGGERIEAGLHPIR